MALELVITNAGRAALIAAANNGTNAVTIASCGVSATATAPTADTVNLPGEIKRIATLAGDAVADDTIHVTVRDESAAAYSVRSIALYLQDGTLFAAYGQAGIIAEKSSAAMLLFALDIKLDDIDADTITFGDTSFLNPPATVDRAGVVELATEAEAIAGTDSQRAITPKGLLQAIMAKLASWGSDIWRASNDGAGSGLDADLLDGRQASEFALLNGNPVFNTVRASAGSGNIRIAAGGQGNTGLVEFYDPANIRVAYIGFGTATGPVLLHSENGAGWNFLGGTVTISSPLNVTGAMTQSGSTVWNAGNDGAGSGLDADLLDGRQASEFALLGGAAFSGAVSTTNLAVNGVGTAQVTFGTAAANYSFGPYNGFDSVQLRENQFNQRIAEFSANASYISGTLTLGNSLAAAGGGTFGGSVNITGNVIASATIQGNDLRVGQYPVWHVGNDGSGSGLDADLLDGHQASELAFLGSDPIFNTVRASGGTGNIRLAAGGQGNTGYVEFNDPNNTRVAYMGFGTAAGPVLMQSENGAGWAFLGGVVTVNSNGVWNAGNDGSGSGLDADLLDGRHAGEFALLSGATFTGRVNFSDANYGAYLSGGNPALLFDDNDYIFFNRAANAWSFNVSGTAVVNFSSIGLNVPGVLTQGGNQVWHVGNDGSGSGLDADLLDGRHASDFALASQLPNFTDHLFSANGYQVLPGGLILQWVTGTSDGVGYEGTKTIFYPLAFPNAVFQVIPATRVGSATTSADEMYQIVGIPGNVSCVVQRQRMAQDDAVASVPVIFAIGY